MEKEKKKEGEGEEKMLRGAEIAMSPTQPGQVGNRYGIGNRKKKNIYIYFLFFFIISKPFLYNFFQVRILA